MAKKNYRELSFLDIQQTKCTGFWKIGKDKNYYYKTLQEQNLANINGSVQKNLEFMMDEKNQSKGINPVVDIYYQNGLFFSYRTPIVQGKSLNHLKLEWDRDLAKWDNFIQSLITVILDGSITGYVFPDLFTEGNILY